MPRSIRIGKATQVLSRAKPCKSGPSFGWNPSDRATSMDREVSGVSYYHIRWLVGRVGVMEVVHDSSFASNEVPYLLE